MITSYQEAEDAIFALATSTWNSVANGAALYYDGQLEAPLDPTVFYGLATFKIVSEGRQTVGQTNGQALFEAVGLFSLQIYAPIRDVAAYRTAKAIAEAVKNAFCTQNNGDIWFSRQRSTPVGNEFRNQVNVTVTCTYQTIK